MRYLVLTIALAVALGSGDFGDPWAPGMACGEYRAQADNYATALQRVADCMDHRDTDESRTCVERVLAETEE